MTARAPANAVDHRSPCPLGSRESRKPGESASQRTDGVRCPPPVSRVLTQRTCHRFHRWIVPALEHRARLHCLRPNMADGVMPATLWLLLLHEPLQNRRMRPILRLDLRSRDLRTAESLPPRSPALTSMPKLRAEPTTSEVGTSSVQVRASAILPILACCGSWQGLILLEWKIEEVEVGRAEG